MINKIDNNCSFRANLKPSIRIKEQARFDNIQELFSKLTKQYPDETLYLSQGEKSKLSIHTSDFKYNISCKTINTELLTVLMKKYSHIEIAKRFADAFKILRLTDLSRDLTKKIEYNKEKFRINQKAADNLRSLGKKKYAEKYEQFAKFNKDKIKNLDIQYNDLKNHFIKQQEILSISFPEVMQVNL